MASYLSGLRSLNPVPCFPDYTGPHKVGTVDIEVPVNELDAPSPAPDGSVPTILFRVFYPCVDEERPGKAISWLPGPARAHLAAYTQFLGASPRLADFISIFPRLLYWITIPVRKNAPLLSPTTANGRWPVMVFSHGLGGSRNAYSHLVGSIASHGVIVIAPEHRDSSCPLTLVRDVPTEASSGDEKSWLRDNRRRIEYNRISHTPSPEVEAGRTKQLKIRTYELGALHDALLKIDGKSSLTNLNTSAAPLDGFAGKMDLHTPGSISYAGHSFGAATVAQFVKSIYYAPRNHEAPAEYDPVFVPSARSPLTSQITSNTPLVLLDMWCLPLRAKTTRHLWNLPLPCYAPSGPGGAGVLAVESQAFVKWRVHLKATKRFLSPDPSSVSASADPRSDVHFYYPVSSAHLSQSDFGILFPFFTRKIFASEEPERLMKLNVRAILQLMRERGVPVAPTCAADLELGSELAGGEEAMTDDKMIFDTTKDAIRGWVHLTTDGSDLSDVDFEDDSSVPARADVQEAVVGGELMKDTEGARDELEGMEGSPGTVTA